MTEPTTDLAVKAQAGGEVATLPPSVLTLVESYTALDPRFDIIQMLREATGEDNPELRRKDFDQILVPSETSSAFEVPDDSGGTVPQREVDGIIVGWWKSRGLWLDPDPTGKPPLCKSNDNKAPVADGLFGPAGERGDRNPGHVCETCPMSQWGSARDGNGKRGRGQMCKESMSVLLLRPDTFMPVIVRAPATSMDGVRSYFLKTTLNAKSPFYGVVSRMSLVKDQNREGRKFNTIALTQVSKLDADQLRIVRAYKAEFGDPLVAKFKENPTSMQAGEDAGDFDDSLYAEPVGSTEPDDDEPSPARSRGNRS